jgi:hypothetical protein
VQLTSTLSLCFPGKLQRWQQQQQQQQQQSPRVASKGNENTLLKKY